MNENLNKTKQDEEEVYEPSRAFKVIRLIFKYIVGLWTIIGLALLLIVLIDLCFYPLSKKKKQKRYYSKEATSAMVDSKEFYREKKKNRKKWRSYVYWRRDEYKGKYLNIDKAGVRKTWNKIYPSSVTPIKIFMFGGSTIWGEGTSDDYTIPSYISKELAKAGVKAKVINYGETAYVQTQELITFIQLLQSGKRPDVVIFYDGVNDAYSTYQNREAGLIQNALPLKTHKYFNEDTVKPKDAIIMTIKRISRISRYLKRRKDNELIVNQNWLDKNVMPELAEDTLQVCLTNLQILHALSKQYNFKLLCFWQPNLYVKKNIRDYEQRIYDINHNEREFVQLVYTEIAKDNRFSSIPYFYNLQAVLDHIDKAIYIDFCHVNKYGNEIIAKAMFKPLMKQLNLPRSK